MSRKLKWKTIKTRMDYKYTDHIARNDITTKEALKMSKAVCACKGVFGKQWHERTFVISQGFP